MNNIDRTAFYTVSSLAVMTAATATGTLITSSPPIRIALAIITALGISLSASSSISWYQLRGDNHKSNKDYFNKTASLLGVSVVGVAHFIAQTIVLAALGGFSRGLTQGISSQATKLAERLIDNIISTQNKEPQKS